ncbi:MAG: sigma-70 family RNA polymerase sigma factor [Nitrospinota bacterium]|nr:sigma-70 family RNA polymerase sigma factor [Nitrospinota bacterium]MDH5755464.1 sigma-70 family RNA polymerase sigma factor [Nitrospinota bacterium]
MPQEDDFYEEEEPPPHESAHWEPDAVTLPSTEVDHRELVPIDPLQQYINKIRLYPQLTQEEEAELAERYMKTGDREAAFRLVTANLMMVVKIAFEFHTQFQNMLDLIQEGNYGLMRAVKKYDPFKGARLSTYAAYWVRAYMLKYLLDNWRLVKVGTTNMRRKLLYRLRDMEEKLSASGEPVSVKLLAEHFGASEEDVIEVQKSIGAHDKSIYQPVGDDPSHQVVDILPGADGDYAHALGESQALDKIKEAVAKFMPSLRPVERTLLERRVLADEPVTLREIGEEFGVTREAVRQTEERLLKKLKDYLKIELGIEGDITTPPEP